MDNSLLKTIKSAPKTPGVYLFLNQKKEIIYVGKAISLQARLKSYLDKNLDHKTKLLIAKAYSVKYFQVFSEIEALILEAELIKKHQPLYNLRLKDDKSFLYIGITQEEFPKVLAIRKKDLPNHKYLFGPFPSAKTVHDVLSFLRKIYPFCQENSNRHSCFWSHLKLCDPCPGDIMRQGNKETKQQLKKRYLSNIRNLVSILNGKSKNLVSALKRKMDQAVKLENFEDAALYRNQIQRLNYITKPNHFSLFLESPNFFEEEQKKEENDLVKLLNEYHVIPDQTRIQGLRRIECYDISNLQGQFAVGSMVVFIHGVADKSQYRRFKISEAFLRIKMQGQPNDVAMMGEILGRRMKHNEWNYPDLIVVDGGKPQLSAALKIIQGHCEEQSDAAISFIPVIALAKRLETIILSNMKEINLPANSPALNLLKRLRDETHRFGLSYHRKLRRKAFLFD